MSNSLWRLAVVPGLLWLCLCTFVRADDQPDAAMLAAAERVAHFIETGDSKLLPHIFADGDVTILENFAPYRFQGTGAIKEWTRGMRAHLVGDAMLHHNFGIAKDFDHSGDQVYFSLPTTWQGLYRGSPFTEKGGWSFLLTKQRGDWRVRAYAWAVTEFASY